MSALARQHEVSSDLRPGDFDLSDPKTFVAGVPHEYFRVLREQDPVHWQAELHDRRYPAQHLLDGRGEKVVMYRFPNPSLAGPPERIHSNFLSGIDRLPLKLA